jgi:hypothetical protein
MRTWIVAAVVSVLAACSGDAPPGSNKCLGEIYQSCNEEHDCSSGLCQNFPAEGFQVCSQACDAANPCPDDAECDADTSVCKPAAADDCNL